MWVSLKKQMNPIYQKINSIAQGGSDNIQEYFDYVDELIKRSSYGLFQMVVYEKYNFDTTIYPSVSSLKKDSWKAILFKTNSKFQELKYDMLKSNLCYQIGLTYYQNFTYSITASIALGTINEIGVYATSISNEVTSDEFQKKVGNKTTYLLVEKFNNGSPTQSASFSTWDISQTYDSNLLSLYTQAITYLI